MTSTPNSERLICPNCSLKLVSTKTLKMPDETLVSCSTCKTKFSLAQGRGKEQAIVSTAVEDRRLEPQEEVSKVLDNLPPPLDFPPSRTNSIASDSFSTGAFEPGASVSHFESETTFGTRTKGLAKEVVEVFRPKIREIPSDIAEVLDAKDIVYASNPAKTAKILQRIMLLVLSSPIMAVILFQMYRLFFVSFTLELILIILSEMILVVIPFVILNLSWKNTFYVITRDKIVIRSGIFNRGIKIAWVKNVQEISINSGVVDRWLNLNTIHFSTASSGIGGALLSWIPGASLGGIHFRHVELSKVLRALKSLEL